MLKTAKSTLKIKMAVIALLCLLVFGSLLFYFVTSSHKSNFKVTATIKYKDFTLQVNSVKTEEIKLGEIDPFYLPVWGRTENDFKDCSGMSTERLRFALETNKEHCERTNDDIRRDLASKVGIAAYLHNNTRLNVNYNIVSKNNELRTSDVHIELVSGDEDLATKTFPYGFVYASESGIRSSSEIAGGSLTKNLSRGGLAWADIKTSTPEVDLKVVYKGVIKTVSIQKPFKY